MGAVSNNQSTETGRQTGQDLTTCRLRLRSLCPADAPRVRDLSGNLRVARNLERVPHPYPEGLAETWIEAQSAARARGEAYVFAIELAGDLIGVIGIERRGEGDYALGYWLGEPWWGQGLMSEAAARAVRFAFEDLNLPRLVSRYFVDNPASGRILEKCGFQTVGRRPVTSRARSGEIDAVDVALSGAPTTRASAP